MIKESTCDGKDIATYEEGKALMSDASEKEMNMITGRLFPELHYSSYGLKLKLEGIRQVEGVDAYLITIEYPSGRRSSSYFGVESGYLNRVVKNVNSYDPSSIEEISLTDYRNVDGIGIPHAIVVKSGKNSFVGQLVEIEHNTEIDPAIFSIR